ncbi:hypothetical protein [Nereida sp. MMG025]|uniref:hypothetical protein n=1 Tax=Nereida sp. MMG025 TaxID=2909981 RepID=UPI001F42C2AD|nr:hypothetical protein [Nereida sp. MMG025]MCF6445577.1 hypothetical protein [Nereida sp. MMG025]
MSIHSSLPDHELALSPWQASTLDAMANVRRMEADIKAIRHSLSLRPREMTGPTTLKLAQAEDALDGLRAELLKLFQTI